MFVLMTVAVVGAALIGEWIEAATVVVLFALAQALERRSLDRARHAIRTLVADAPADVTVRRGGALERVPSPRSPSATCSSSGRASASRSTATSSPAQRRQPGADHRRVAAGRQAGRGDQVFAGTINGTGALDVARHRASATTRRWPASSTWSRRAQAQRAPAQRCVDRFARALHAGGARRSPSLVAIVPPLALAQPPAPWLYRALVLLVIACPCALVISTPVTIVVGARGAARQRRPDQGRPAPRAPRGDRRRGGRQDRHADARRPQRRRRACPPTASTRAPCSRPPPRVAARSPHPVARAIVAHAAHAGTRAARGDGGSRRSPGSASRRPSAASPSSSARRAHFAARGGSVAARGAGRRGDGGAGRRSSSSRATAGDRPDHARRRAERTRGTRSPSCARAGRPPRRDAHRRSRAAAAAAVARERRRRRRRRPAAGARRSRSSHDSARVRAGGDGRRRRQRRAGAGRGATSASRWARPGRRRRSRPPTSR